MVNIRFEKRETKRLEDLETIILMLAERRFEESNFTWFALGDAINGYRKEWLEPEAE